MSDLGQDIPEPKIPDPTDAIIRLSATCICGSDLMGVLSAKQIGAGRIIAMSRHRTRQKLALEFGASDIISERGDEPMKMGTIASP